MATSSIHPIKRIREALGNLSELSGLRASSSTRGFAKWIGCSESLIRNIENGHATLTPKLAERIAIKTGVSAQWMLSNPVPSPTEPVLDRRNKPWDAKMRLDPYQGDLLKMIFLIPDDNDDPDNSGERILPRLVSEMVRIQMGHEMRQGKRKFLHEVIRLLAESEFFSSDIDKSSLAKLVGSVAEKMVYNVASNNHAGIDADAAQTDAERRDEIKKQERHLAESPRH